MFREMIDEAIYLFGGMTPKEIAKEVLPAALGFVLMWVIIILTIAAQPL